jgi:hypothetical protein
MAISYFLLRLRDERFEKEVIQEKVLELKFDINKIQKRFEAFLSEFYQYVIQQFDFWHITPSEKEVDILILKGLTFKEMSVIRNTSERTIRNQAVSIYTCSGF